MRKELIEQLESYGCKIEDKYHKCISHINIDSRKRIQWILEDNGYKVIEQRSSESTIHFEATSKLFKQIAEKYNLEDSFQAIAFFGEVINQSECAIASFGGEYSISHNKSGFHFKYDFTSHKLITLHFGDERIIDTYYGEKCYIDEIECSDAEKVILEAIWKFKERRESIRLLPSKQAPKKCVEYRKLLKEWREFNKILSKDWEHSTFIFGIEYSLERDIEYWEEYIGREAKKYII